MPAFETMDRHQTAVLWTTSRGDYSGPVRDAGVELKVRWVWGQRFLRKPSGEDVQVDATVVVDRDVKEGSLMYLGTLPYWAGTGSADDPVLMEVVVVNEASDLKNRFVRRTLGLSYFGGTAPQSA
jgi:hypothetical protein